MKSNVLAIGGIIVAVASLAFAGPVSASTAKPAPAKLVVIHTCPITGEKVVGNGAGSETVGNYKVFFCCGGCQPEFDKLSKAQKLTKLAAMAKAGK